MFVRSVVRLLFEAFESDINIQRKLLIHLIFNLSTHDLRDLLLPGRLWIRQNYKI